MRALPRTLQHATALVWRAGRGRFVLVSLLQASTALLLAVQVLLVRVVLQAVLDADRGNGSLGGGRAADRRPGSSGGGG